MKLTECYLRLLVVLFCVVPLGGAWAQPSVLSTTGMLADAIRELGGDRVATASLMGPGVDPHLYKLTRSDVLQLNRADLIVYNGLRLEGRVIQTLDRLARAGRRVVAVGERLPPEQLLAVGPQAGYYDPHIWMDIVLWRQVLAIVLAELLQLDPAGAQSYQSNYERYRAKLTKLDAYARQVLGALPLESRVLVTAHDAFGYFGRRYGFEVVGVQGLSTESEAGVRDIERLVTLLVERRIPAVFVESTVSDRNLKALIAGAAARGHKVQIGGELFSDAMGRSGTYRGTYLGMLDHNVTVIARALGAEVPAGGWQGRLAEED